MGQAPFSSGVSVPGNQAEKWILFSSGQPSGSGFVINASARGTEISKPLPPPVTIQTGGASSEAPRWAGHLAGMRTLMHLKHTCPNIKHPATTPCLLKTPAEEQTAAWLVDHLLETETWLPPGFAQSLIHCLSYEVCSRLQWLQPAPHGAADATSPLFSLTHSPQQVWSAGNSLERRC